MATQDDVKQFSDDPRGQAARWALEFESARKVVKKWHTQGEKLLKRFRDERPASKQSDTRRNYFSANVITQAAMLYGQTPRVEVSRRFGDANDDQARVAAEVLERLLNTDIESDTDGFQQALQHALQDRLLPGMGSVRLRYTADFEASEAQKAITDDEGNELAPEVPGVEEKREENVEVEYVPWRDQLWSPAAVFSQVIWWAFRAEMSREQLEERFGDIGKLVPLNSKRQGKTSSPSDERVALGPWGRADVWEIWCKDSKAVYWYVEGFGQLLDEKPDPFGLQGFWPFPRPMIANATTESLVPTPDYVLNQDQYDEIDELSTRIAMLTRALRVVGVYDSTSEALKRLLEEGRGNEMVPVKGWGAFTEKGGVAGAISWLPLEMIVAALDKLREVRAETEQALYQLTGMSDIMRGQASAPGTTATEQQIKAKYGSVRMQSLQDEFARFASDTQRLKAEIISKHFDPQTIVQRSNVMFTADAQLAQPAVQLIKDRFAMWRVQVKSEAVAMADFGAQRSEAEQFVGGVSQFLTAAAPLAQAVPGSMEALLKLLGLVMSKFSFSDEAEGIIDGAIAAAKAQTQQPQAPPPPDPKVLAAQVKAQADQQHLQLEAQVDMAKLQAEVVAEDAKQRSQTAWNIREEAARSRIKTATAAAMPRPVPGGMPR